MDEIAELVGRAHRGEPQAMEQLFAGAYGELRQLARSRLRDGGRNTMLDTTALVHESYLRVLKGGTLRTEHRRAFFGYASQVMRSVIVDHVRERQAQRRGGDLARVTLDTDVTCEVPGAEDQVLHVHQGLQALARSEPELAAIVEMRYFGGFSENEIAEVMDLTDRTIRRRLEKAHALLQALMD
jgi:RNA polymerase sigma factor (TIGR02999 family)